MITQKDITQLGQALTELQSTLHEFLDLGEQTTIDRAISLIRVLSVRYMVKDRCDTHKQAFVYVDPTVARSCLNMKKMEAQAPDSSPCWDLFPVLVTPADVDQFNAEDKEVQPIDTRTAEDMPANGMWLEGCEFGPLLPMAPASWQCPRCNGTGQRLWTNGKGRQGCETCVGTGYIRAGDSRLTTQQPKEAQL